MTGRILFRISPQHECRPGWQTVTNGGETYLHPPRACQFPVGTVWQCECEHTWLSVRRFPPKGGGQMVIGRPLFRREHWWERLRRRWAL